MTEIVGYLVLDRLDYRSIFRERVWYDFSPIGAFATIGWWLGEDDSPSEKSEFIEEAGAVYDFLRRKGCQEIVMAMTLLSQAFGDFELKYLDRELSPESFDDWLALKEIYEENERKEDEYVHKHKSGWGKIKGLLKGKQYRISVRPKGVLAVARIRGDLGENPRSNDE